jgi:hypothetical protein
MAVMLTRSGYGSFDEVMDWTPFRMSQVLYYDAAHDAREQKRLLALHSFAAQGDPKELKKALSRNGA